MRIAIMMRAMEQDNGYKAIVGGLVEDLLTIDQESHFLLYHQTGTEAGRFSSARNVTERVLPTRSKLLWDQVIVPTTARRDRADFIYNPKFSVPLISPCPVGMGIHEPAWWATPERYEWLDRHYMRIMLPLYIRRCAHLFPISDFALEQTRRYVRLSREQARTVLRPRPPSGFGPVTDPARLAATRQRWRLPERFILAVTRVEHAGVEGARMFFPGKNVQTAVRAFGQIRHRINHDLVIAGRSVERFLAQQGLGPKDLERVHCLGFVDHALLPELHSLADLFVIPSFYEGFGMALIEAMVCGDAVIAANTGACPEVGGDAVIYADPHSPEDFAAQMLRVLENDELRRRLAKHSLARAKSFDGLTTAQDFLAAVRSVVREEHRKRPARGHVAEQN